MFTRVQLVMLCTVVALLAASAVMAALSLLPQKLFQSSPEQRPPLAVELIEPDRTGSVSGARSSRGSEAGPVRSAPGPLPPVRNMIIEESGFGTILAAPGRRLVPSPVAPAPGGTALAAEPPVAAKVAGFVRLLARLAPVAPSDQLITVNADMPPQRFGTIILRDGCLKLAEPGEPHAILPAGTKLYVDDDGFFTAGISADGAATNPRLGEPAWWNELPEWQVEAVALERIRAKCGGGAAVRIGNVQSVSASQSAADGVAARNVVAMYGLTWEAALARVRDCRGRLARENGFDPLTAIVNPCGSTPPPPVARPEACPAGTTLSGGLCRTPQGHIRPIPVL